MRNFLIGRASPRRACGIPCAPVLIPFVHTCSDSQGDHGRLGLSSQGVCFFMCCWKTMKHAYINMLAVENVGVCISMHACWRILIGSLIYEGVPHEGFPSMTRTTSFMRDSLIHVTRAPVPSTHIQLYGLYNCCLTGAHAEGNILPP
jgi:hypothetical protein